MSCPRCHTDSCTDPDSWACIDNIVVRYRARVTALEGCLWEIHDYWKGAMQPLSPSALISEDETPIYGKIRALLAGKEKHE